MVAVFDADLSLRFGNARFRRRFDQSITRLSQLLDEDDLRALESNFLDSGQDKKSFYYLGRDSFVDEKIRQLTFTVQAIQHQNIYRWYVVFDEMQPRPVLSDTANSHLDVLTRLPNRYGFSNLLRERIAKASINPNFAILYIDIDHFKDFNELYGHQSGDQLLQTCAERIRALLRKEDVLARVSSDEFVAIVEYQENHEMPYLCHRLMRYFERPIAFSGSKTQLSLSIGIAFYPEQGIDEQTLLMNAEKAMFMAKNSGRAQFQLFDRQQAQKVSLQQRMIEAMRDAFGSAPQQFCAAYQPLYHLQTGNFVGVEVLARWQSPEFGAVPPSDFIPLAETRGLINNLTAVMFERVERDLLSWYEWTCEGSPVVAVNVSAQQLGNPYFQMLVQQFNRTVRKANWQLEIELTESQLMSLSPEVLDQLHDWRSNGIRIAIDDFGTGYSCLAYLHALPIDKLKIDRQFLQADTESGKQDQIIYAILSMAISLDIEVLAEGIETDEHWRRLRELGCQFGQGFGLEKPAPWHPRMAQAKKLP